MDTNCRCRTLRHRQRTLFHQPSPTPIPTPMMNSKSSPASSAKICKAGSRTRHRSRHPRRHRKSVRLSRRCHHHAQRRLPAHRISFRPPHRQDSHRLRHPPDAGLRQRASRCPLFRNCRHRLHRTRHRRRQNLRSLGKEVLGKARCRRKKYFHRARSAGISAPCSAHTDSANKERNRYCGRASRRIRSA